MSMTEVYGGLWQTLVTLYATVLSYSLPQMSPHEIQAMANTAANAAMEHAKAHPYVAGFAVLNIGLTPILGAGWLIASLLQAIGFGPLGPIAGEDQTDYVDKLKRSQSSRLSGSLATWYQATWLGAFIPAGSLFSSLQSWAMTLA